MANQTYINGTLLDVELSNAAFTYSIADIREPDKRMSDYSKTITIKGSKLVNKLFNHIYQVDKKVLSTDFYSNFSPDFNPNLKASFLYLQDGIQIFKGTVQLVAIRILNKVDIEYDVLTVGRFNNLFAELENKMLDELDLSSYDHTYTAANQVTSWSADIGEGYVYPLIDYGQTNNGIDFNVNKMYPAIYVKQYIDSMFAAVGKTYSSDFFNAERFKRLIIPFNRKSLIISGQQISKTSATLYTGNAVDNLFIDDYTGTGLTRLISNNPLAYQTNTAQDATMLDTSAGLGYPTGVIIIRKGNYDVAAKYNYTIQIDVVDNGYADFFDGDNGDGLEITTNIYVAGVLVETQTQTFGVGDLTAYYNGDLTYTIPGVVTTYTGNHNLIKTDSIYVQYTIDSQLKFTNTDNAFNFDYNVYLISDQDTTDNYVNVLRKALPISEGDTLNINDTIPINIKQTDFLSSIVKMFNLYIDNDVYDTNNYIIKPYADYYSSTVVDWTDKVDYNIPIEEIPLAELNAKTYSWKYKADNDFYNKQYTTDYNEVYGNISYDIANDFVKGENVREVIFSTKPMTSPSLSDMNYAVMCDKAIGEVGRSAIDTNITILYYGDLPGTNVNWKHIKEDLTYTSYSYYPYAGHLDNPNTPTFDLLFTEPLHLYYTTTTYTNSNLFTIYQRKQFIQLTDINSKLIRLNVALSLKDTYDLDFTKLYAIDGNYFRLNKVIDYTDSNVSTKVELFKTIDSPAFTGSSTTIIPSVVSYNLVQGGQDELRDIGATSYYNQIQGSADEVRDAGATSVINLISGGLNAV